MSENTLNSFSICCAKVISVTNWHKQSVVNFSIWMPLSHFHTVGNIIALMVVSCTNLSKVSASSSFHTHPMFLCASTFHLSSEAIAPTYLLHVCYDLFTEAVSIFQISGIYTRVFCVRLEISFEQLTGKLYFERGLYKSAYKLKIQGLLSFNMVFTGIHRLTVQ